MLNLRHFRSWFVLILGMSWPNSSQNLAAI